MLHELRIDHNIVPEIEIDKFKRKQPYIVDSKVFESVVAELIQRHREEKDKLEDEILELKSDIEDIEDESVTEEELANAEDRIETLAEECNTLEKDFCRFKGELANYLADNESELEKMSSYFSSCNLEEIVDEYAD